MWIALLKLRDDFSCISGAKYNLECTLLLGTDDVNFLGGKDWYLFDLTKLKLVVVGRSHFVPRFLLMSNNTVEQ
jgi:hypothetical protein